MVQKTTDISDGFFLKKSKKCFIIDVSQGFHSLLSCCLVKSRDKLKTFYLHYHISISTILMATKSGRVVTYLDGFLSTKLYDKLKTYLQYHNEYV